jgi:hypothetical protein
VAAQVAKAFVTQSAAQPGLGVLDVWPLDDQLDQRILQQVLAVELRNAGAGKETQQAGSDPVKKSGDQVRSSRLGFSNRHGLKPGRSRLCGTVREGDTHPLEDLVAPRDHLLKAHLDLPGGKAGGGLVDLDLPADRPLERGRQLIPVEEKQGLRIDRFKGQGGEIPRAFEVAAVAPKERSAVPWTPTEIGPAVECRQLSSISRF